MQWVDLKLSCRFKSVVMRVSVKPGGGLHISEVNKKHRHLQTAVLFTSCYPMALTDRPTKDDKAEKLQ